MFEVPGVEVGWAEVVRDAVNVAYSYANDPVACLVDLGIEMPAESPLQEWRPGVFATFAIRAGTPNRVVAKFVDRLLGTLLGCGDDYCLNVSVVRLK